MWIAPLIYALVSFALWRYNRGLVFMPELLVNPFLPAYSSEPLWRHMAMGNAALAYFGGYWAVSVNWARLKPFLRNEFVAALLLWGVNVLILFPLIGRGVFGYRLPQNWHMTCLYLLGIHWVFGRLMQIGSWSRQD